MTKHIDPSNITSLNEGDLIILNQEYKRVDTMTSTLGCFYDPLSMDTPQISYFDDLLLSLRKCYTCHSWEFHTTQYSNNIFICQECNSKIDIINKLTFNNDLKETDMTNNSYDLDMLITKLVKHGKISAKELAKKAGIPYSTLMREINPLDTGAKLGVHSLLKLIKASGDTTILDYMRNEVTQATDEDNQ